MVLCILAVCMRALHVLIILLFSLPDVPHQDVLPDRISNVNCTIYPLWDVKLGFRRRPTYRNPPPNVGVVLLWVHKMIFLIKLQILLYDPFVWFTFCVLSFAWLIRPLCALRLGLIIAILFSTKQYPDHIFVSWICKADELIIRPTGQSLFKKYRL